MRDYNKQQPQKRESNHRTLEKCVKRNKSKSFEGEKASRGKPVRLRKEIKRREWIREKTKEINETIDKT